jgi:hypothetical protein
MHGLQLWWRCFLATLCSAAVDDVTDACFADRLQQVKVLDTSWYLPPMGEWAEWQHQQQQRPTKISADM